MKIEIVRTLQVTLDADELNLVTAALTGAGAGTLHGFTTRMERDAANMADVLSDAYRTLTTGMYPDGAEAGF